MPREPPESGLVVGDLHVAPVVHVPRPVPLQGAAEEPVHVCRYLFDSASKSARGVVRRCKDCLGYRSCVLEVCRLFQECLGSLGSVNVALKGVY